MSDEIPNRSSDVPSHPEEMKTVFDLRVGKMITLQGSARITPAGVIASGITVALLALAVSFLSGPGKRLGAPGTERPPAKDVD